MTALPPTITERAASDRAKDERAERLNRLLTVVLCRVAGFLMFCLGTLYWIRIVGVHEGALWRFDLMPTAWKVAAASLAVLYPVAGVGLWMTVSWGAVIWALIVIGEALMHVGLPEIFGEADVLLTANVVGFLLLLVLRLVGWWEGRRRLSRSMRPLLDNKT
ncbi:MULTISPECIES: DUF6163 family protein [unclassified Aureimonas]|uniref:DUF6163 family protein n=1 Tax=unclassified Aureimonas TaxID=2615206 RepID=UPI0006FC3813|nr:MULTISPECIES: DUF6163 family protein [unclassified Aureimonas]KQT52962.1 hypothetical protein ASG62_13720 [Aureimonas sp. Leaf427]KQT80421.1 hypothetical protein ASG54_07570 [Aureimonas sp. Leaf460]